MPMREERLLLCAESVFMANELVFYIAALPGIKFEYFSFHLEAILLLVLAVKILMDRQDIRYASSGTITLYLLILLTKLVFLTRELYDAYLFYQSRPNGPFWGGEETLVHLWILFGLGLNVVLLIAVKRKEKEYDWFRNCGWKPADT